MFLRLIRNRTKYSRFEDSRCCEPSPALRRYQSNTNRNWAKNKQKWYVSLESKLFISFLVIFFSSFFVLLVHYCITNSVHCCTTGSSSVSFSTVTLNSMIIILEYFYCNVEIVTAGTMNIRVYTLVKIWEN